MTIRIVSFNIHKGVGWGKTRDALKSIHQHLTEMNPQIVFLQEILGSQFELFLPEHWPHTAYGKNTSHAVHHYGNAILSAFPISFTENFNISAHRYEKRGFLYALTHIKENANPLHLICTHLGLLRRDRKKQLNQIVSFIQQQIPPNEKMIFAGDFNDWTHDATQIIATELGLQEAFLAAHRQYARTFPAWAPILRLDRLYYRGFKIKEASRLIKSPWRTFSDHLALDITLEDEIT